ncbi:MAG: Ig-like domain repeat protein [Janthinobacterium lividum]
MKISFQGIGRKLATVSAPLFLAAISSATAAAATFYVSPSGSDNNDGLSPNTSWQTVAKVNGSSFQPGDQILFQRGGQWHESLIAPSSGAAGAPITFADYGSGAKPKFWGSIVLNNSQFYPVGNGVYAYNSGVQLYSVLANQSFFNYSFGQFAGAVSNSFSFSNGQLFINSPNADPRSDGLLYTAVVRDDVVYSNYQSHLVFQNLVTDESARYDDNGGYGFRIMGSTDVQVLDCEAYHAGKHNFGVINSTQFIGRDLAAAYAAPGQQASGGASAYVSYGDSSTGMLSQTSEWHNISATNMDDPQDNTVYQAFLDHGATLTSLWVDGLQSSGAPVVVSNSDNTSATTKMTGGVIQNARLELDGDNLLVDGTELTGTQATIDVTSSDTTLQNLVMYGTNLGSAWYQTALLSRGTNNTLRFSTIYMDPGAGSNTCVALTTAGAEFNMYANALIAPQRVFALWDFNLGGNTIQQAEYNFYAPNTTFASFVGGFFNWVDVPLSQWQNLGFDSGSKQGNPMFVNASGGDFRLAPGSPLIDSAPLPSSLLSSVPTDFAGNPRLQGNTFDMGALESTGTVVAQAVASTTTLSQNNGMLVAEVTSNSGSGLPTGFVSFYDGSNLLGPANLVNGTASFVASLDTTIAHTLTAVYSGDANFLTSTSAAININPVAPAVPSGPVVIVNPTSSETVNGLLTVTANITVNLDAAGSFLILDGQGLDGHRVTGPPYLYFVDTTQLTPGTHTVQVWAHDVNNGTYISNPVSFVVSN